MQAFIKAVGAGPRRCRDLTRQEAREAFGALLATDDDAQAGGFLLAMRMKGETAQELAGFVDALGAPESPQPGTLDVDAHGDGRSGRACLLPAAATLAARSGIQIDLRIDTASPDSPPSHHFLREVLATIGPIEGVRARELGRDHVRLKELFDMRARVGVRTFVNSVVKLWSPRLAPRRLIGIFHGPYHEPMAGALALLGAQGLVVQAPGGLPEPPAETRCKVTSPEAPAERIVLDGQALGSPEDAGPLPRVERAEQAAALNRQVLDGARGPARHQALLSAAVMLVAAGKALTFQMGYACAAQALASPKEQHA